MTRIKSWSNSVLGLYEQCAFKYMCAKIAKIPEPQSYHLTKGLASHTIAENYLLGKIQEVPYELNKFAREFRKLRELGAAPEEAFTLNNKWELIPDGWRAKDAWLRLKLDARIDNYVVDFKTGRHYDDHKHQAKLYSNAMMMVEPSYDEVDVEFWYLHSGIVKTYSFHRDSLKADIGQWEERVEKMHNDITFKPTPNEYCKYCHFIDICPVQGDKNG
jgi:CRISPR/Cas system-associated exonuclease Cas4 (RecB family)